VLSTRKAKWVFALVLLVAFSGVKSAPTIGGGDEAKLIADKVSPASNADVPSVGELELFKGTSNSSLTHIATEILKPPVGFMDNSALPPGTKHLPPVPAALFMGLTGFICVTLVRDRKVWLTVVATLLWIGQIGITALPKAAVHLVSRKHQYLQQQYSSALQKRFSGLRINLVDREYAGLLHHLEGIPAKIRSTKYDIRYTILFPSIIDGYAINTVSPCLIRALNCLSFEVRQFFCFSPAFIFESMPRGPPKFILS
jgi:hypothetical protein